ncbi:MAG: hypothetical protein ACHP84_01055 [Caulobacterales bacterium]
MDPISSVDRLVLLLRQRLTERARATSSGASEAPRLRDEPTGVGPDTLHALAAIEGIDDRQLKRALVQNILADNFGTDVINDAAFQQVVDRVTETLQGDRAAATLLSRLVQELRATAR